MRTGFGAGLVFLVLAGGASLATAQQVRPHGLTEQEYQAKKRELKGDVDRLLAEHSRYAEEAPGLVGVWEVSGLRRFFRNADTPVAVTEFGGEVVISVEGDEVRVSGPVRLEGRVRGRWVGEGTVSADGRRLETRYESTIGGVGAAEYVLQRDGSLRITWASDEQVNGQPKSRGHARARRPIRKDQADLERRIYELNHAYQFLIHHRPEPSRYASPGGEVLLRFTPTVEFDPDGVDRQVLDLIAGAERTIDVCTFELSLTCVARALADAHDRGVRVRVVYDQREAEQPAIALLAERGVPSRSDDRTTYMHNKFIVIDGALVWTGSTNLSPRGVYLSDNHSIVLRSERLASQYTIEFEEMFVDGQFGITSPQNTYNGWIDVDPETRVQVYFAPEDDAMDRIIEVVRKAERSIRFIAFAYTSDVLADAMIERIEAGVIVEGIFERRHAGWPTIKIGPLHAAGARVRFDSNPNALHHKVIVVDDRYVCTGSFNFSDNADRVNDENMLVIDSIPVARTFVEEFEKLMSTTDPDHPRIATAGMPDGAELALAARDAGERVARLAAEEISSATPRRERSRGGGLGEDGAVDDVGATSGPGWASRIWMAFGAIVAALLLAVPVHAQLYRRAFF